MSATDDLIASNREYAASLAAEPAGRPSRGVAVVACMDARMDVYALLGLAPGRGAVRGFVYDVTTGLLREVS
jgi:carbonic anhydrase